VFFQKLPPCLVGIEACASSHHWSRELQASAAYFDNLRPRKRRIASAICT
jgi:transposase